MRFAIALLIILAACEMGNSAITSHVVAEVQPLPKVTCTDSDEGIKPGIPGDVKGMTENEEYSFEDDCYQDVLVEFYCENGMPESKNVKCQNGCRSGACQ